ncbi:MAG: KEOPS complex subunit Cgi121 [archaeon]|nr:KEOPS complex subunit Cgi121 [archaeon]
MLSKKLGKNTYTASAGRISTDSYGVTIKKLALAGKEKGSFAQLVPHRLVAGPNHLFAALEQAMDAIEKGSEFTKSPELEFIVRLVAEKQLDKALKAAEFGKEELVLVVLGGKKELEQIAREISFEIKEGELRGDPKQIAKHFQISEKELAALADLPNALEELAIERTAFVSLAR